MDNYLDKHRGMDFDTDGKLYAAVNIAGDGGTGSDHLVTINPVNGQAQVIGPFGVCSNVTVPSSGGGSCTIEGIEGIAFDSSGKLWGSKSVRGAAGQPGLYTINTTTGNATFNLLIQDPFGKTPSGGVVSLQFVGNTLYGGTARAINDNDGGWLVKIDPSTGQFEYVGSGSITGGSSLGALAFKPVGTSSPALYELSLTSVVSSRQTQAFKPPTGLSNFAERPGLYFNPPNTISLSSVAMHIFDTFSGSGDVRLKIFRTNDTIEAPGNTYTPSSPVLSATSNYVLEADIPAYVDQSTSTQQITFSFPFPVTLDAGIGYLLLLERNNSFGDYSYIINRDEDVDAFNKAIGCLDDLSQCITFSSSGPGDVPIVIQ